MRKEILSLENVKLRRTLVNQKQSSPPMVGGGEFPSKEEKREITQELKLCILELERWLSG